GAGLGARRGAAVLLARAAAAISPLAAVRTAGSAPVARRWPAPSVLLAAVVIALAGLVAQVRFASAWAGNVGAVATDVALVCLFMRLAGGLSAVVLGPLRARVGFASRLALDRLARLSHPLPPPGARLPLRPGPLPVARTPARPLPAPL